MNIFVTGGAGFIGSHVVKHHLGKGDKVWIVDDLSAGRKENLGSSINSPSLRFDVQDILNWDNGLREAVAWADRIYHMVAVVGQKAVIADPWNVLKVNIRGCERLLEAMPRAKKGAQLLIASSSSVYGHDAKTTYREDAELKVMSGEYIQQSYSLSKLMNEELALVYSHQKGFSCTIARLFNVVGLHQTGRYGMVIPNFVQQALKGQPLTVHGDGKQTRSFCNALDAVAAMDLLLSTPHKNGEIVNVGSDREISIYDLAMMVRERTHSKSEIRFVSYREALGIDFIDIRRRQPNLEKLIRMTGFKHKYTLEQTIDQVIESYTVNPKLV